MNHPAFVQFLCYFNGNRDYFECHEVLEDYWKEVAPRERQHPLTGWIQLATGLYHWRRGNFRGASTILSKASTTLQASTSSPFVEKVEISTLLQQIKQIQQAIEQQLPYKEMSLIITDSQLHSQVQQAIKDLPVADVHFITHKHRLRDRTDVLQERNTALQKRHIDTKRSRH